MHASFKDLRIKLGYSQTQLAHLARISVPTLQNIEAGRANPTAETLDRIARVLGYEFRLEFRGADWNLLAAHGVPLLSSIPSGMRPFLVDGLFTELKIACLEMSMKSAAASDPSASRKAEALVAFLHALKSHFPTRFKKLLSSSSAVESLLQETPLSGRIIKLKRQALAHLATYL